MEILFLIQNILVIVSQCVKRLHKIGPLDYLKIEIAKGQRVKWTFCKYKILYTKYKQSQTKGYARKTVPLIVQIYEKCEWCLESFNYNDKILIVNECACIVVVYY